MATIVPCSFYLSLFPKWRGSLESLEAGIYIAKKLKEAGVG